MVTRSAARKTQEQPEQLYQDAVNLTTPMVVKKVRGFTALMIMSHLLEQNE